MSNAAKRRGRGEDAIYFDAAKSRWYGVVSLGQDGVGNRKRRKISGRTKTEVKDKLRGLHAELAAGVCTPANYTVARCIRDWLDTLGDKSPKTRADYTGQAQHMIDALGSIKLSDLTARAVQAALQALSGSLSTRTIQLARLALIRAIRHAEFCDLVMRNVAALTTVPRGTPGRPSKSLSLAQAIALLDASPGYRLHAYVVLCLLAGLRPEEARGLTWTDVDLDAEVVYVLRADRFGSDTKTPRSRRGLQLPDLAVSALRSHALTQAAERVQAGPAWQEHDLVFASLLGTPLDPSHVRRSFRLITKAAGLGTEWTPRELRHTFVSVLSDDGMPLRDIADLVGHTETRTTETVYRHQLRPVLQGGARAMDTILARARTGEPNGEPMAPGIQTRPATPSQRSRRSAA